ENWRPCFIPRCRTHCCGAHRSQEDRREGDSAHPSACRDSLMADLTWSSPPEHDPKDAAWEHWTGSVLTSDEIDRHCTEIKPPLLDPYDARLLKPARYQLRLGPEARVGGEDKIIDKDHPLVIPPHQVAIVRTRETLVLPRYLIGRWNLTVGMVYKGLLWVGALQVDPCWVGYLTC